MEQDPEETVEAAVAEVVVGQLDAISKPQGSGARALGNSRVGQEGLDGDWHGRSRGNSVTGTPAPFGGHPGLETPVLCVFDFFRVSVVL